MSVSRYEAEQIASEKAREIVKRNMHHGPLYDEYEDDYNEIWDAIEKLQEEVTRLRAVNKQLMLANGIITKTKEA